METWKTITEFPNYQVSTLGRVKNTNHWGKERLMTPCLSKGYWVITLVKDKKKRLIKVHRLLAEAFVPNPLGLPFVDHINRNRSDNQISNLRWADASTNGANRSYTSETHHITQMSNGWFHCSITRNHINHQKNFKTLEEAILYRDAIQSEE